MVKTPDHDPDIAALDEDAIQELNPLDEHHIKLRWVAVGVAIFVIIAAGILEVYILHHFELWQGLGDFVVFLAITPIMSITIIVIFILIGSFRKPSDAEMNLPDPVRLAGLSLRGAPE